MKTSEATAETTAAGIACPRCRADAVYGYGHIKNGKQRYLCLLCNRQFVPDTRQPLLPQRPACPLCGGRMHIYMRRDGLTRFRCATYPSCRGFLKEAYF
jgi:transposase-like protein